MGVFISKCVFALGNWRFSFEMFIYLRLSGVFLWHGAKAEGFLSLWIPKISGPAAIHFIYIRFCDAAGGYRVFENGEGAGLPTFLVLIQEK